ncbi:hypothetical protein EK904_004771 [Melospiza melodia maxima]|nr:hypothetical protein EK904_004771 [Melospiza melodia maxima]
MYTSNAIAFENFEIQTSTVLLLGAMNVAQILCRVRSGRCKSGIPDPIWLLTFLLGDSSCESYGLPADKFHFPSHSGAPSDLRIGLLAEMACVSYLKTAWSCQFSPIYSAQGPWGEAECCPAIELSLAGAGYRSDVHSWRKERTMCILKDVKGESTLQLLSSSDLWARNEGGGVEDKQARLQKGSKWLEAGMRERETLSKGPELDYSAESRPRPFNVQLFHFLKYESLIKKKKKSYGCGSNPWVDKQQKTTEYKQLKKFSCSRSFSREPVVGAEAGVRLVQPPKPCPECSGSPVQLSRRVTFTTPKGKVKKKLLLYQTDSRHVGMIRKYHGTHRRAIAVNRSCICCKVIDMLQLLNSLRKMYGGGAQKTKGGKREKRASASCKAQDSLSQRCLTAHRAHKNPSGVQLLSCRLTNTLQDLSQETPPDILVVVTEL